jgi:calcineurin-like phosphoesterase family protein
MNYFYSDPHWNHVKLAEVWGKRKWKTVQAMNDGLVEEHNAIVKAEDTCWILGDVFFQPKKELERNKGIVKKLNGNIKIVIGNHDTTEMLIQFGFKPENIYESTFIEIQGIKFFMAHFPYPNGMKEEDKTGRPYAYSGEQYENGKIIPLICGHVHDRWALVENCLNVGWDIWHKPLNEQEIIDIYKDTNGFINNFDKYNAKDNL